VAKKGGSSFGNFNRAEVFDPRPVKPITTEFSKGSVPDSIYAVNRESAWSRWRRGYEIATACFYDNSYDYPFTYTVPIPAGTPSTGGNQPTIPGVFKGFPTKNKEFGMHWAGVRVAGSLRFDNVLDSTGVRASISSVTEDANFWYVKLTGTWSVSNPLPPPLYVAIPGVPGGLKAINGEILEDRIITPGGTPITRDTIDPTTQKRYGYVSAVLADTDPFNGILKIRKAGSVEATPDRALVTPATRPPNVGRFFMTGTRYCCSCQDFNRRDYGFMSSLNKVSDSLKTMFPRTNVASLKPGRYEVMTLKGVVDNNAMTSATENRDMRIISPAPQYNVPPTVTPTVSTKPGAARDNPGVFRDFGAMYIRDTSDPSLPGSRAEGMPSYEDYSAAGNVITSLTDTWTPLLDEMRYCKHIYAMKYEEGVFPPEPSDFPVGIESMAAWEQKLVAETESDQIEARAANLQRRSLSTMDVPPYNCQAPMMMPMMQKLFNIPSTFVKMAGFTMIDKNGGKYIPASGQRPAV
jgi:hypothetical protein